jgi:hypothetical protein
MAMLLKYYLNVSTSMEVVLILLLLTILFKEIINIKNYLNFKKLLSTMKKLAYWMIKTYITTLLRERLMKIYKF